ncbi:MAG: insulinase family protein [Alphaproteobacteria bacterium]|nr:insulinase family protein [Alphaproteobacteria bacterium]
MLFFKKLLPIIFLISYSTAQAAPALVSDPEIITGVLDNGLTYHLYTSNDEQKDDHDEEISLRLYVQIGSLDENDEQKGYAHLVEHLGFRDSRYFTHKQKNDFLENLGLHTNAYTTYNRTVYYVNDRNPTDERMVKNLQLFRDFADGMFITSSDFELERKIVLEELRLRASKEGGIDDKMLEIYDNGQYLDDKKPIGTKEVLNAATRDSVYEFMATWYQPQHMHFIVTGQIDAKKLEQQIIEQFSEIKTKPAVKQAEPVYKLPEGIHFATADDSTSNGVTLMLPLPSLEGEVMDAEAYQKTLAYDVISGGIDSHLQRKNDALGKLVPYIGAGIGNYEHRLLLEIYIRHKEGERNEAIEFALKELASLRQYGLSQAQFENQLDFIERRKDKPYSPFKKDGRPAKIADEFIADIEEDFIHLSEDAEEAQLGAFLDEAKLEPINENMKKLLGNDAALIVVSRELVSDENQEAAAQLVASYNDKSIEVAVQNDADIVQKELPEIALAAGSITAEKTIDASEITQLTLSNGAHAYLLHRKKDEGHVSIGAFAKGGSQSLPVELLTASIFANNVISASGIGGFEQYELAEYMSKKRITRFRPFMGGVVHGFGARLEKVDSLEDVFNLLHMSFYQGKIHSQQFEAVQKSTSEGYAKWLTTEDGQYQQLVINGLFEEGLEYFNITPEQIDATQQADIQKVYEHFYSDLSQYHFVIAGDFDDAQVRGLLEKYIASIPSEPVTNAVAKIKLFDRDINIRATNNPKDQSSVSLSYHTDEYDKSFENNVANVIGARILTKRIYDIMRKEEGLTYSVRVNFQPEEQNVQNSSFSIRFSVKPTNEKQAIAIVDTALQDLIDNPISEEEFIDKRDKMLEDHEKVRNSNASNARYIGRKFALGYDLERVADLVPIIKATKYELVRDGVVEFFGNSRRVSTIFSSENAPE